jgi:hypothetical protein
MHNGNSQGQRFSGKTIYFSRSNINADFDRDDEMLLCRQKTNIFHVGNDLFGLITTARG